MENAVIYALDVNNPLGGLQDLNNCMEIISLHDLKVERQYMKTCNYYVLVVTIENITTFQRLPQHRLEK
jgi:hypothetical protein